jgi:pimeloyl-ACP methyl ester carboxylesterase
MRHPGRVTRLVVMEGLLGPLPGAEAFLAGGPPWWFGFHAVPGLAETVLEGHEDSYLDFFLTGGTAHRRGIDPDTQAAFVRAYRGREALRCAFELYRAMPLNGEQVRAAVARARTTVPTMAIGGGVVGDALHRQLEPIADHLVGHVIPDCGHIVPQEQPEALLELLLPFLE